LSPTAAIIGLRGVHGRNPVLMFLVSRFFVSLVSGIAFFVSRLTILGLRDFRRSRDAGMSTAEYAVGTVAAVAFAVVLYKIVRSPAVSSALSSIVQKALHAI
jgi:hypothetical protein